MADERGTIEETAKTELDSGPVAQPNFTQPLERPQANTERLDASAPRETKPRSAGAIVLPRRSIGRFRIDGEIGSGGMADVFRAYDPMLEREVALKVLQSKISGDTQGIRRVLREARAAAALTHPNTVTIYEVGEADGEVFIAMELLHGKVLRELLVDEDVTLDQKLRWLLQAARALHAAHRRGLVHRDVKPENMFVCADGTLKLLDFGIAKRDTDTGDDSGENAYATGPSSLRTEAGRRFGTPRYMAPEQHGGLPTDARTDEYAWGLVAFELLSGSLVVGEHATATAEGEQPPLGASAAMRIAELHAKVPALHDTIARVVAAATEPKQGDRLPSMAPIIEALERELAETRAAPPPPLTAHVPVARSTTETYPPRNAPTPLAAPSVARSPSTKWLVAGAILVGGVAVLLGIALRARFTTSTLAQQAQALAPACRITSTRVVTRPPAEKVRVLGDGKLVFVHDPAQGVAVDLDTPQGPTPMLPFPLGHKLPDKLQTWRYEALDYLGHPSLFVAAGFGETNGIATSGTMIILGETMPWGVQRLSSAPSGFAVTSFGKRAVLAATSMSLDTTEDIHGITLYVFGTQSLPVDVEPINARNPSLAATRSRLLVTFVALTEEVHAVLYDDGLTRVGDVMVVGGTRSGQPIGAFAKDSVLVYNVIDQERKSRLVVSSFHVGREGFDKPTIAIDDAVVGELHSLALADDSYLLAWTAVRGGQTVLRISPVGEDGLLTGASDIATAADIKDLAFSRIPSGVALAWNDGQGHATIADVTCQLPDVRTPAR